MLIPVIWILALSCLAVAGYCITTVLIPKMNKPVKVSLWILSSIVVIMWLGYSLCIFDLCVKTVSVIRIRALPGIEFTALFLGVFSALLQSYTNRIRPPKDKVTAHNGVALAIFLVIPDFLLPVVCPPDYSKIYPEWKDGVCLQSTGYDCGPSAVATIMEYYGVHKDEKDIAREVLLSRSGTDVPRMIKYLRKQGFDVNVVAVPEKPETLPVPCIACIRLGDKTGIAHVVVIYEDMDNSFLIGDPLASGKFTWSKETTYKNYYFDQCVLHVTKKEK